MTDMLSTVIDDLAEKPFWGTQADDLRTLKQWELRAKAISPTQMCVYFWANASGEIHPAGMDMVKLLRHWLCQWCDYAEIDEETMLPYEHSKTLEALVTAAARYIRENALLQQKTDIRATWVDPGRWDISLMVALDKAE